MVRSASIWLGLSGVPVALLAGCNLIAGLDAPTYDPSLDNPGNTTLDGSTTADGDVITTDSSIGDDSSAVVDSGPPPFIDLTKLSLERIAGQPGGPAFRDGTKGEARFANPQAIVSDPAEGVAYVLDSGNRAVRKISLADGSVSTLSRDGMFLSYSELRAITIVTVNKRQKIVVVASRNALIAIDEKGNQSLLAGLPDSAGYVNSKPGQAKDARFNEPVALATNGDSMWVADRGNCSIRLVTSAGEVSTVIGDGRCTGADLPSLTGIAFMEDGTLLAASSGNLYAVTDPFPILGKPSVSLLTSGVGEVSLLASKNIFGVDPKTHVVRAIGKGSSTIVAGMANTTGFANAAVATQGTFNKPSGIAFGIDSQILVADSINNAIRVVDTKLDTLTGDGPAQPGANDGNLSQSKLSSPEGVAFESLSDGGSRVTTIDSSNKLRLVDLGTNTTNTLAITSEITGGRGVVRDSANAKTYVSDATKAAIYVFEDGQPLKLLAGTPGSPGGHGGIGVPQAFLSAHFTQPSGLALDSANGVLYVADAGNQVIRKLDLKTSMLNTIGGPFTKPIGVTLDKSGNLYISDRDSNRIWRLAGAVTTCIAGDCDAGNPGRADGSIVDTKPTSRFTNPEGLVHDGARFMYIADTGNHTLRAIDTTDPNYRVITILGKPVAAEFATGTQNAARLNAPAWITLIQTGTDLKTTGIIGSDRAENVLFRVNGL